MTVMRLLVGSWISRIYLAVVAAVFAYELWLLLTWDETASSMTGVLPVLLAFPVSWLLNYVPWPADWHELWRFTALVVVGTLANAAFINGIHELCRRTTAVYNERWAESLRQSEGS